MGTNKQQSKQTKHDRKAAKEAAREAARREERRRQLITLAVVVAIVVVGGGLAGWMVYEDRQEQARLEAEQEELLAELEAEEETIAERGVACGADEPEGAGEDRAPYDEPPPQVLDEGEEVRAVVATSCGELVLDLDAAAAPETVNAFVHLAEDGFYDGREVFRHAEGIEVLQTGSGTDDAGWDVGFDLPGELDRAEEVGYPVGTVAIANPGDPDQGGSQFFLVYGEAFEETFGGEDPAYTNFGEVVEGLDVLEELADIGVVGGQLGAEVPAERIYLESVSIERGE